MDKTPPTIIVSAKDELTGFQSDRAYLTWTDGTYARVTPVNGDPLDCYQLKVDQISPVEIEGYTIHKCQMVDKGLHFDPPLPLNMSGLMVWRHGTFVQVSKGEPMQNVFFPGSFVAVERSD